MAVHPAWLFPVPVRPSRFLAADAAFSPFNVEVDLGRIAVFSFSAGSEDAALFYDLQTQLDDNSPGRHGSGRSGVYLDRYLKGVGRTPAAANWSAGPDIYHGSGHLSVGSALRERLITLFLEARGLGATIVPCEGVLLGPLNRAESRAVRRGETSSREASTRADAHMVALTVKPADFARMSNFVYALDHFPATPQQLGTLFLDLERFLHPPGEREGLEGAPDAIARALDAAFRRGLERFEAWARAGLLWIYLQSNFGLDGRFLDLETPLFIGTPFVGAMVEERDGEIVRSLVGFEEFGYVRQWRLFLAWLRARLRLLTAPELLGRTASRPFLRELSRAIAARFPRQGTPLRRRTAHGACDDEPGPCARPRPPRPSAPRRPRAPHVRVHGVRLHGAASGRGMATSRVSARTGDTQPAPLRGTRLLRSRALS